MSEEQYLPSPRTRNTAPCEVKGCDRDAVFAVWVNRPADFGKWWATPSDEEEIKVQHLCPVHAAPYLAEERRRRE